MQSMISILPDHSVTSVALDRAKMAIEQFIYSCSHTLRSPLKSIAGLVYLLKNANTMADANPEQCLQSIEQIVCKMEVVLNELEQFLSNSRQDIMVNSIDLRQVIDDVLAEHREVMQARHIKVIVTVSGDTEFYADESRVRIVLSHIVANAVTFQQRVHNNRRIGLHVNVCDQTCRISVRDNGIGIADHIMPRIFDLFYRGAEQSTGSGVGLYVAGEVMKKIGGHITLRSMPGRGTGVVLTFPNLSR